jgi:hypothetical protein
MSEPTPAIVISHLAYAYGRSEAVHDFSLTVPRGKCCGLFGRNGAGKTTTMKCLLNLLRPRAGQLTVLGLDPIRQEVEVKRRLAYVPDQVAFYPWMTIRETLDYLASFRSHWNRDIERSLVGCSACFAGFAGCRFWHCPQFLVGDHVRYRGTRDSVYLPGRRGFPFRRRHDVAHRPRNPTFAGVLPPAHGRISASALRLYLITLDHCGRIVYWIVSVAGVASASKLCALPA